jgi:hypothetical protein
MLSWEAVTFDGAYFEVRIHRTTRGADVHVTDDTADVRV